MGSVKLDSLKQESSRNLVFLDFHKSRRTVAIVVFSEWRDLIGKINDEADTVISDFDSERSDLENDIEDLETEADEHDGDATAAEDDNDDDAAEEARTAAEAARTCMAEKQALLDSLDTRKADALREVVDEIAS
jgi:hypothetical protein